MKKDQLLAEVEDVLRLAPSWDAFGRGDDQILAWIGRAAAAIERWSNTKGPTCWVAVEDAQSVDMDTNARGFSALKTLLQQARADLRMEVGQLSVVVPQGQVFDYFDELRKVIEAARSDVFFIDPYLDADFVSRYLPHVANGVTVRLLCGPKKMTTLLPAVGLFVQQSGTLINVRSSDVLHDRYLFIDRSSCYLSGASFKDGAKNAPATLTQITDAFHVMWDAYDRLWSAGKVER